jgi:hypothetical protein
LRINWNDRYTLGGKTYDTAYAVIFNGDDFRHEGNHITRSHKGRLVPQEYVWVWRADEFRKLMQPGGVPYPQGVVAKPSLINDFSSWSDRNLTTMMMVFRPFHALTYEFADFGKRFRVVNGTHLVEGRECILLQGEAQTPSRTLTSLSVDPERAFALMRVTWQDKDGKEFGRIAFHEYRNNHADWVPARWTTTFGSTKSASVVADCQVNPRIVPEDLELEFPPGTLVDVRDTRETYIAKDGGKRRLITREELLSGSTYEDFLETESGILAPGKDATDADDTSRQALVRVRERKQAALKADERRSVLVVGHDELEVRVETVPLSAADVRRLDRLQVAIDDASCEQMLFGKGRNSAAARKVLVAILQQNIDRVDRICELTDAQRKKLELSGGRDISLYLQESDEFRPRIQKRYDQNAVRNGELEAVIFKLCRETQRFRDAIEEGIFGKSSLFAKTLNTTLTVEQTAKWRKSK